MLNKLGKLLKYEFLFYFRILLPLYLLIILIAVAIRFQGLTSGNSSMPGIFLMVLVLGALSIAMCVITIILVIQRYIDNFLKESGYLMFSLPVTVWALIASKAIAAFCMIMLGYLSIIISTMIHSVKSENWEYLFNFVRYNPNNIILSVVSILLTSLQQICLFYAVITVAFMLPRFRNLAAFAMYFFIMFFVEQNVFKIIERSAHNYTSLVNNIASLIFAAIFFYITGFLLKRSYNLE